jgi:hypothetical protein
VISFQCRSIQIKNPTGSFSKPLYVFENNNSGTSPLLFQPNSHMTKGYDKALHCYVLIWSFRTSRLRNFRIWGFHLHHTLFSPNVEPVNFQTNPSSELCGSDASELQASKVLPIPHNLPSEHRIGELPERLFGASLLRCSEASDISMPPHSGSPRLRDSVLHRISHLNISKLMNIELANTRTLALWSFTTPTLWSFRTLENFSA